MNLISPLTWGCIYIPFVPMKMWETVYAMQPYILGFSKIHKRFILNNICNELEEKIIVDIDEDSV